MKYWNLHKLHEAYQLKKGEGPSRSFKILGHKEVMEPWSTETYTSCMKHIQLKKVDVLQDPSRYYATITNLSSFNTSQNIIFQKSSYQNRPTIT
jgi:hypothetical protein